MSWTDDAAKALSLAGSALHALEAIGPIVKTVIGARDNVLSDDSLEKLAAVSLAVDAIRNGLEGKVSIESVDAEIDRLHSSRENNMEATESEID